MKTDILVDIMDCTVRDGTYLKNFQLNRDETLRIGSVVDKANVPYFEVGHGLGVAGARRTSAAAESDIGYCQAACDVVTTTRWGTFCIGGLCTLAELKPILDLQPAFVRVGIDPGGFDDAQPLLSAIARSGVTPMIFFMKSYAWDAGSMAENSRAAYEEGAEFAYVVDSAGTMLPAEVAARCRSLREAEGRMRIGFHGHNNLGLAVANSLAAVDAGARIIDGTLMGVGRSGGNCGLEQLTLALLRTGFGTNVDAFQLLEFSESSLCEIFPNTPLSPLDVVIGFSGFHTAFLKRLRAAAERDRVSVARLIVEVCKLTQVEPTDAEIQQALSQLKGALTWS